MDQFISTAPAMESRTIQRDPGQTPTNGTHAGIVFAHVTGDWHGPAAATRVPKTKASSGDIVGRSAKPAAPRKKSSLKKTGAAKAK